MGIMNGIKNRRTDYAIAHKTIYESLIKKDLINMKLTIMRPKMR